MDGLTIEKFADAIVNGNSFGRGIAEHLERIATALERQAEAAELVALDRAAEWTTDESEVTPSAIPALRAVNALRNRILARGGVLPADPEPSE